MDLCLHRRLQKRELPRDPLGLLAAVLVRVDEAVAEPPAGPEFGRFLHGLHGRKDATRQLLRCLIDGEIPNF